MNPGVLMRLSGTPSDEIMYACVCGRREKGNSGPEIPTEEGRDFFLFACDMRALRACKIF